jgi:sugar phosphate isomerase/epimerase
VALHAKDAAVGSGFAVEITECPPGEGVLDYSEFLACIHTHCPDAPLIIEHLPDAEAYRRAGVFVSEMWSALRGSQASP